MPNLNGRKLLFQAILCIFILNILWPLPIQADDSIFLPRPGVIVHLSPEFNPPMLKGVKVSSEHPFRFDFILDKGDSNSLSREAIKQESSKLIKYFLASLTIPEKDLWVNLSPYEKDRIIPESFGLTEMGRDLLMQDYMLKQITASLIYPEEEVGKKFWKKIYKEAAEKYHTTHIPVNTFNKVWIVPDKAIVYENARAGTAYVVESKLKVMLEEDYLASSRHYLPSPQNDTNALGSQIIREIVLPEITKEINTGKNFVKLRQVYQSLILATWYKKKIKESLLREIYLDKNKTAGIDIYSNSSSILDSPSIYQRYLQSFKKGVYNYIKEETDLLSHTPVPRKYFSGGLELSDKAMKVAISISSNANILPQLRSDHLILTVDMEAVELLPSSDKAFLSKSDVVFSTRGFNKVLVSGQHIFPRFSQEHLVFTQNGDASYKDITEQGKIFRLRLEVLQKGRRPVYVLSRTEFDQLASLKGWKFNDYQIQESNSDLPKALDGEASFIYDEFNSLIVNGKELFPKFINEFPMLKNVANHKGPSVDINVNGETFTLLRKQYYGKVRAVADVDTFKEIMRKWRKNIKFKDEDHSTIKAIKEAYKTEGKTTIDITNWLTENNLKIGNLLSGFPLPDGQWWGKRFMGIGTGLSKVEVIITKEGESVELQFLGYRFYRGKLVMNSKSALVWAGKRFVSTKEIKRTKRIIGSLIIKPLNYDFTKKKRLISYLVGKSFGLTDSMGRIYLYPFLNYDYFWSTLGFPEKGWDSRIIEAKADKNHVRFTVQFSKEGKTILRVFKIGGLIKKLKPAKDATRNQQNLFSSRSPLKKTEAFRESIKAMSGGVIDNMTAFGKENQVSINTVKKYMNQYNVSRMKQILSIQSVNPPRTRGSYRKTKNFQQIMENISGRSINCTINELANEYNVDFQTVKKFIKQYNVTVSGLSFYRRLSAWSNAYLHRDQPINWTEFSNEVGISHARINNFLNEWMLQDRTLWSAQARTFRYFLLTKTKLSTSDVLELAKTYLMSDQFIQFQERMENQFRDEKKIMDKLFEQELSSENDEIIKQLLFSFDFEHRKKIQSKILEAVKGLYKYANTAEKVESIHIAIQRYDWTKQEASLSGLIQNCKFAMNYAAQYLYWFRLPPEVRAIKAAILQEERRGLNKEQAKAIILQRGSYTSQAIAMADKFGEVSLDREKEDNNSESSLYNSISSGQMLDEEEAEEDNHLNIKSVGMSILGEDCIIKARSIGEALRLFWDTQSLSPHQTAELKAAISQNRVTVFFNNQKIDLQNILNDPLSLDTNHLVISIDDQALYASTGGIDLTSDAALQVQNNGSAISLQMNPVLLKQFQNSSGLVPVIINIQLMKDLRQFLGVQ